MGFKPNLSTVAAGVPVLSKGTYEFSIGEVKPAKQNVTVDNVQVEQQVVRTSIKIESTEDGDKNLVGKFLPYTMNPNNEYGLQFAKLFLMAALGYNKQDEHKFNTEHGDEDEYEIDADSGTLGEIWKSVQGRRINANVNQYMDKKTGEPRNNFGWFPF